MLNDDPIAFFLTWVTYGTWLPGDKRGWVEYRHGWKPPSHELEADCRSRMDEEAVKLTSSQRWTVEQQVAETCRYRGWHLHAVNCRSNHIHTVVTAIDTAPGKIRNDLKAYATRCLKSMDASRKNWWAERGSIRWIYDEDSLQAAITYVIEGQETRRVSEGSNGRRVISAASYDPIPRSRVGFPVEVRGGSSAHVNLGNLIWRC